MNSGVYTITNTSSGMKYIGRTSNWTKRRRQHVADLKAGRHGNDRLQKSWDKRGQNGFTFKLDWPEHPDLLEELEGFVLEFLFDTGRLYNIHKNSRGGMLGMAVSDDAKKKQAIARSSSEKVKAHIEYLKSEENKRIAIAAAKSPEARAKAVATRAANGFKAFSDETRRAQMDAAKARVFAALDWAVATGSTRDAALMKFKCSWDGLKKYQPAWEEINGPLVLPKRASGEKNGRVKWAKSRKETP